MSNNPLISIVSPVYGCGSCIEALCARINKSVTLITTDYEIILICDASPDNSWELISALAKNDARIRGYLLSRNFGQHYAITAGLDQARGTWTIVMDCDLQDRPEEIPALYRKATEGFDVVFGQRSNRQDSLLKRLSSRLFYSVLNYLSDASHDAQTANFGIYHHRVVEVIRTIPEQNRCFPLQVKWAGFRRTSIEVKHDPRAEGQSSYSLRRLIRLAVDITLSYSDKPLRLSAYLGFMFSFAAVAYALVILVRYAFGQVQVLGYTSIIISIWLIGGLILFCLGVAGLYIGRIYESAKGRPVYIISASTESP